jgi:ATP-dependent 26S proteasome regulatory subunit
MKQRLVNYFKAGFPCVAIHTAEEQRAQGEIIAAAKEVTNKDFPKGRGIITWSATEGLNKVHPTPGKIESIDDEPTKDLVTALKHRADNTIYIFRDPQTWPFDRDYVLIRALKDMLMWAPNAGSCVVLLGSDFRLHNTFEQLVTVVDFGLPEPDDLRRIAASIADSAQKSGLTVTDDVVRALGGFSTGEAENALALSIVEEKKFCADVVYREKVNAVKRGGLLEIISADKRGLDAVGGCDILKDWILKRKLAYTPEAEAFGLPAPKGLLAVGVPGAGKSLLAKTIGTALGIPTVKLDIGSLFNSLVGESESRCRDALKFAEAMAPCVLWLDEIDKGLAGNAGGGDSDSGVTKRVFGTIITWMQERKRPVFLVATANSVTGLPPELLRKGRFDEIFFVDLPNAVEREAIFNIHLKRVGRDATKFNMKALVGETQGYTGSEIEEIINAAMYEAFYKKQKFTGGNDDTLLLVNAANATVPLSKTAPEKIEVLRSWAKTRARRASSSEDEVKLAASAGAPGKRSISE